ncbi:anhydro-N-acetylmuramic acid kinase [Neisseria sp. Ec49-e6-T10]|uniref:anhydro-N-acetylmuramic acid kinase n=1 Tax=Neisseria sp. Ec49-e6-T10 TaxID=3140744 RepID=UPI003EBADEA5
MQEYYVGLMSGTSLDAVDAVLIQFNQSVWQGALGHTSIPFSQELKQDILALQYTQTDELHKAAVLANKLSHIYAQVVNNLLKQYGIEHTQIKAIGCHGQTIRHNPMSGYTIQLVNLALLAELTAIDVIGDFRTRDIAAGGQGAPLVPAFHQSLFAHPTENRAILNIGGIANITILPTNNQVFGFDTGPGNMLMDAWVKENWQKDYDESGLLAQQGSIMPELLNQLLSHAYFSSALPKSTGRDLFNLPWLKSYLTGQENPFDVQATLLALTCQSIVLAIQQYAPQTKHIFICGGGAQNKALMQHLQKQLPEIGFGLSDELGLNSQWVEAAAFAWLAQRFTQRLPGNIPMVTGALDFKILGALYPA